MRIKRKYLIKKVAERGEDVTVDATGFDAFLRRMIAARPQTFKEVTARPKSRKDGGIKRNAKKGGE